MIFTRIVPLLMIIGAAGLFIGYVQPTYSGSIVDLTTEIRDLDTALAAATDFKEKEIQLTRDRAAITDEQITRLESFLPDNVDNVRLIVDLNSLAARSGVQLSEFSIESNTEASSTQGVAPLGGGSGALALSAGEPTDSLDLSVAATGSYAAFQTFLLGVENSLRHIDVVEISVTDSQTGIYTYDITFRLYWLK